MIISEVLKLKSDSEKSVKSTKKISEISDKKSVKPLATKYQPTIAILTKQ